MEIKSNLASWAIFRDGAMNWSLKEKVHKLGDILAEEGLFDKKQVDEAERKLVSTLWSD